MDIEQIKTTIFLLEQAVKLDNGKIKKHGRKSKEQINNIETEIEHYKANKQSNKQIKKSFDKIINEKYTEINNQTDDDIIITDETIPIEKVNKIISSINKKVKK